MNEEETEIQSNRVTYSILIISFLIFLGTVYFHKSEGWSYVDAFYFSTMTLTTIGYGDLVPTNPFTKIFAAFYALFGIGVMIYLLGTVMGGYVYEHEKYFDRIFKRIRSIKYKLRYHLPSEEAGGLGKYNSEETPEKKTRRRK